jgi:hypothetical protein
VHNILYHVNHILHIIINYNLNLNNIKSKHSSFPLICILVLRRHETKFLQIPLMIQGVFKYFNPSQTHAIKITFN